MFDLNNLPADSWTIFATAVTVLLGGIVVEDVRDTFGWLFDGMIMRFLLLALLMYCVSGNLLLSLGFATVVFGFRKTCPDKMKRRGQHAHREPVVAQ
jgi:hypothetical protein